MFLHNTPKSLKRCSCRVAKCYPMIKAGPGGTKPKPSCGASPRRRRKPPSSCACCGFMSKKCTLLGFRTSLTCSDPASDGRCLSHTMSAVQTASDRLSPSRTVPTSSSSCENVLQRLLQGLADFLQRLLNYKSSCLGVHSKKTPPHGTCTFVKERNLPFGAMPSTVRPRPHRRRRWTKTRII